MPIHANDRATGAAFQSTAVTCRRPPSSRDTRAEADEALADALKLPQGAMRNDALKKASQLRMAADAKGILFAKRGRPSKD